MRLGKDLVGKPIYSVTEGKLLGEVKDLYLDNEARTIMGIYLGKEGLFRSKALLIPREGVAVFGLDAVLVKNDEAVTDSNQFAPASGWLRRGDLQGRGIDTPGGTKVGTVGDVLVDGEANVIGFSLARVHVEGPIAQNRLIAREAVQDIGQVDGVMTVDITRAEALPLEPLPEDDEAETNGKLGNL